MLSYELELTGFDENITKELAEATVRKFYSQLEWFNLGDFVFEYHGKTYTAVPQQQEVDGASYTVYSGKILLWEGRIIRDHNKVGAVYTTH